LYNNKGTNSQSNLNNNTFSDTQRKFFNLTTEGSTSNDQAEERVPAIDCERRPEDCQRCVVEKKCRNTANEEQNTPTPGGSATTPPESCYDDSDCDREIGFFCRGCEIGAQCNSQNDCDSDSREVCTQLTNDGNTILKVDRTRACGQWLACRSSSEVFDETQGKMIEICDEVIIAIGSTQESKTGKNPFTYEERKEMVLKEYDHVQNITIIPLVDIGAKSKKKWIDYLTGEFEKNSLSYPTHYFSGSDEDASWYTETGWKIIIIDRFTVGKGISATKIREQMKK